MQLPSATSAPHGNTGILGTFPKLDTPAFHVGWDLVNGGDDEGRSDELTFTPTGSVVPVGWTRTVDSLAKAAQAASSAPADVWGAFQTEDGADFLAKLQQSNRLPDPVGRHRAASVADLAATISTSSWMATRDDARLVAVADASTALDASTWATL